MINRIADISVHSIFTYKSTKVPFQNILPYSFTVAFPPSLALSLSQGYLLLVGNTETIGFGIVAYIRKVPFGFYAYIIGILNKLTIPRCW